MPTSFFFHVHDNTSVKRNGMIAIKIKHINVQDCPVDEKAHLQLVRVK